MLRINYTHLHTEQTQLKIQLKQIDMATVTRHLYLTCLKGIEKVDTEK